MAPLVWDLEVDLGLEGPAGSRNPHHHMVLQPLEVVSEEDLVDLGVEFQHHMVLRVLEGQVVLEEVFLLLMVHPPLEAFLVRMEPLQEDIEDLEVVAFLRPMVLQDQLVVFTGAEGDMEDLEVVAFPRPMELLDLEDSEEPVSEEAGACQQLMGLLLLGVLEVAKDIIKSACTRMNGYFVRDFGCEIKNILLYTKNVHIFSKINILQFCKLSSFSFFYEKI